MARRWGLAVAAMVEVLAPHTADRDWQTRAGSLEWSWWTTAAHVAHDLLAYAGQVTSRILVARGLSIMS